MQSNNETNSQGGEEKRTFIGEARRAQIIEAAIEVLDESGYGGASLAQIAKKAGISTALVSYHFANKQELMETVLTTVVMRTMVFADEQVAKGNTARERLLLYIEASIAHRAAHPKEFSALLEVVFNMRMLNGQPSYREDEEHPSVEKIEQLLEDGQKNGEFRDFNVHAMAITIMAAIDQYAQYMTTISRFELKEYVAELLELFDIATRKQ